MKITAKEYIEKYKLDTLSKYKTIEFDEENKFNIIHLYDTKKLCYPHGYHDAKWFEVVCYNTTDKTCYTFSRQQDSLFLNDAKIMNIRIFVDGSTCLTFNKLHKFINIFQASTIIRTV